MTPSKKHPVEGLLLGKQIDYPTTYSPQILLPVPREVNRVRYGIDNHHPPFTGMDVWHAYEAGFLTQRGLPVSGILKIIYPASSEFIVESKSLKLYLNSFNMEKMGIDPKDGSLKFEKIIQNDLESVLKSPVIVRFFNTVPSHLPFDFHGYKILEQHQSALAVEFIHFAESPQLLTIDSDRPAEFRIGTHLLRSNCKITHQPDWGSAYIHIRSNCTPSAISILQYIVSLRNENHFHEEICEMMYKRLMDKYEPDLLMVTCIYTRRGGIDICPVRASHPHLIPSALTSKDILSEKLIRQ